MSNTDIDPGQVLVGKVPRCGVWGFPRLSPAVVAASLFGRQIKRLNVFRFAQLLDGFQRHVSAYNGPFASYLGIYALP
jgi:hypothetical protein